MNKLSFEALRAENKVSQEDVAKLLGITTIAYRRKEKGVTEFKFDELLKMSDLFNVSIDAFKHP